MPCLLCGYWIPGEPQWWTVDDIPIKHISPWAYSRLTSWNFSYWFCLCNFALSPNSQFPKFQHDPKRVQNSKLFQNALNIQERQRRCQGDRCEPMGFPSGELDFAAGCIFLTRKP
eukprot:10339055-Karenia_brevis.AAC.1